jgi:hypothetical protein
MIRLPIAGTIDASFEWTPSDVDRERAVDLYGKKIEALDGLTLVELARLLFDDLPEGLHGGQYLQALMPSILYGGRQLHPDLPRPTTSRPLPGRIVYGDPPPEAAEAVVVKRSRKPRKKLAVRTDRKS